MHLDIERSGIALGAVKAQLLNYTGKKQMNILNTLNTLDWITPIKDIAKMKTRDYSTIEIQRGWRTQGYIERTLANSNIETWGWMYEYDVVRFCVYSSDLVLATEILNNVY